MTGEKVKLSGWDPSLSESSLALLYGEMIRRAGPIIKHYHSDMFHDARWLAKNLNHMKPGIVFYWQPREWGTYIGFDKDLVCRPETDGVPYEIKITSQGGMWYATFTRVDP